MPREARPFDMQSRGTSTGSESLIFTGQIEKFLPGSPERNKYFNQFRSLRISNWIGCVDNGSTCHSECRSLNKRALPRLASPGETLRERVDLIVVPARE
jgi:hypothetical protein